jgi:hypothetical protein
MLTLTQNPMDFQAVVGVSKEAKELPGGIILA